MAFAVLAAGAVILTLNVLLLVIIPLSLAVSLSTCIYSFMSCF